MGDRPQMADRQDISQDPDFSVLEPLRRRLLEGDEADRFRLLGSLFDQLADVSRAGVDGRSVKLSEQTESLVKKVKSLGEERANLQDTLAQAKADTAHHTKQLEAEQSRNDELQKIIEEQRSRLEGLNKSFAELEADLVAKNSRIHQVEVENEDLKLQLQRSELAQKDTSRADRLEDAKRDLSGRAESLSADLEQLRADKDAEIAEIKSRLLAAKKSAAGAGDVALETLWQRLATAKPAFVEGHIAPTPQAAERLFDAFMALASFADNLDQDLRPFLDRYTKYNETVRRPWSAYQRLEQLHDAIRSTIEVKGHKPVDVLKMRLANLKAWSVAALLAGDRALEGLGSELEEHMMGPAGVGSNPQCKVREYIKGEGHLLFGQRVLEVRSQTLSEAYARFLRAPSGASRARS